MNIVEMPMDAVEVPTELQSRPNYLRRPPNRNLLLSKGGFRDQNSSALRQHQAYAPEPDLPGFPEIKSDVQPYQLNYTVRIYYLYKRHDSEQTCNAASIPPSYRSGFDSEWHTTPS